MERNDLSFSVPTWRRQQIRSLTMIEEESLYAGTPYNLHDFKNQTGHLDSIFSTEIDSDLKDYQAKRTFNYALPPEIAVFVLFLMEAVILGRGASDNNRTSPISKFKQHLYSQDLCCFSSIPAQWKEFYKNEIIKKIIFQYLSKCLFNMSLIQLLLINNSFLRFSIILIMKTILLEAKILTEFNQNPTIKVSLPILTHYFQTFFSTPNSFSLTFQKNAIKTEHYFLLDLNRSIYLFRKEIKAIAISNPHIDQYNTPPQAKHQKQQLQQTKKNGKDQNNQKQKSPQKTKKKNQKTKKPASTQTRKSVKIRQRSFWDCLPCFKTRTD